MCYVTILGIFLALFFVLSFKRPDWAVTLIIAGLPLYLVRFSLHGTPSTLLEAMILIAFFCWLVFHTKLADFLRGKYKIKDFIKNSPWQKNGSAEKRKKYPFGVEIILLLIVSLVAVGVAHFSSASLGLWKAYFFEPALLYVLILNLFHDKNGINKFGLSLAVGAFAVSVYAIFQKITGIGIDNPLWAAAATRRAVSFFGYPNAVGLYLAPIIPVLAAFLFLPKDECELLPDKLCYPLKQKNISALGLSRGFLGFIILCALLAIIFAKSVGALVGLAVAVFIFCLLVNKKARIAAIILVVIASVGIYFYPPIEKPLIRKITVEDLSGQIRRLQWKETFTMMNGSAKIWGIGLGNYQQAVMPHHQKGFFYDDGTDPNFHADTINSAAIRARTWQPVEIYLYPHNIILNFWTELGLAGLLLFIWLIVKFSIFNFQFSIKEGKYRFIHLGLLSAMIIIVVHGLVDVPYFKNDLACLFWILFALSALLQLKLTSDKKSIK
jgi:O-Antigen ligase.